MNVPRALSHRDPVLFTVLSFLSPVPLLSHHFPQTEPSALYPSTSQILPFAFHLLSEFKLHSKELIPHSLEPGREPQRQAQCWMEAAWEWISRIKQLSRAGESAECSGRLSASSAPAPTLWVLGHNQTSLPRPRPDQRPPRILQKWRPPSPVRIL